MQFENGCRTEYGPLILRLQATSSLNRFTIFVEDPRLRRVFEHATVNTVESAQKEAVLRAKEYLQSGQEPTPGAPEWRCS